MSESFWVVAVYKYVNCADQDDYEEYEKMMRDANSVNSYELVKEKDGKYHIYFSKDDTEYPNEEVGILDEESTLRIKAACRTNTRYKVEWDCNNYEYITYSDGTKESETRRAGGKFTLTAISWKCPKCNREISNDKDFCAFCGTKRPGGDVELWNCKECGWKENVFDFCSKCGAPKNPEATVKTYTQWKCQACGAENNTHYFCGECGAEKGEKETAAQKYARLSNVRSNEKSHNKHSSNVDNFDPKFAEQEYQSWYEDVGKYEDDDYDPYAEEEAKKEERRWKDEFPYEP